MAKKPAFVPDEGLITMEVMENWSPAQRKQFDRWVSQQLIKQIVASMAIKTGLIVSIHLVGRKIDKST